MPLWTQNLLVFAIVGSCLTYVSWQGVRAFAGKRSKLGSCCAKGCQPPAANKTPTEKIHFLPVEMLGRKK